MAIFSNKKNEDIEIGFGKKKYNNSVRFLNPDGSVNINRTGSGGLNNIDIFHWLTTCSLFHLISVIILGYALVNFLFASVYFIIGAENFGGIDGSGAINHFFSLYFFSAQTLTTLGYGHMYPVSHAASTVAAFESLLGLMSFALATGILYGRFSRPKADLLFSNNILISPYGDIKGLMFRLANQKQYELIECETRVIVSYNDPETGKREFDGLPLEVDKINFLALSWTIVHPLNEESPLYGLTLKDYEERDVEVLILFKATNDTFTQTVFSRRSYKASELIENAKFTPIKTEPDEKNRLKIDVTKLHEYSKLS